MANVRHTLRQVAGTGALFAAVEIDESAVPGTPALGDKSSPVGTQDDFSLTDNSVGNWTLTIKNFKGPVGVAFPFIQIMCSGTFGERSAKVVASSYSGDNYSVQFEIFQTSTGAAADSANAFVGVWAF